MATKTQLGSVKRLGNRYGRRVRYKLAEIEAVQKEKKKCPYCNKVAVRRIAVGIWSCSCCKAKFTGKAYDIDRKLVLSQEIPEERKITDTSDEMDDAEQSDDEELEDDSEHKDYGEDDFEAETGTEMDTVAAESMGVQKKRGSVKLEEENGTL